MGSTWTTSLRSRPAPLLVAQWFNWIQTGAGGSTPGCEGISRHFTCRSFDSIRWFSLTEAVLAIASDGAKDGAPLLSLSPPPGKKRRSFISQQIEEAKQRVKSTVALFTAPGKGDRLVQFVYGQLPYHPERIETGTAWTVALSKPLDLTFRPPEHGGEQASKGQTATGASAPAEPDGEEWRLRAYLQRTISSTNDKPGDTFQAVVAEPVFNPQHDLVVPEGSVLVGEITQAKPARSFGRQGKLRFRFKELKLPSGFSQPVTGTLAGINSTKSANLEMDPEGSIRPQSQNRVIAPLVLILLAGRGFDDDGTRCSIAPGLQRLWHRGPDCRYGSKLTRRSGLYRRLRCGPLRLRPLAGARPQHCL